MIFELVYSVDFDDSYEMMLVRRSMIILMLWMDSMVYFCYYEWRSL
jgi:hypothetical protein